MVGIIVELNPVSYLAVRKRISVLDHLLFTHWLGDALHLDGSTPSGKRHRKRATVVVFRCSQSRFFLREEIQKADSKSYYENRRLFHEPSPLSDFIKFQVATCAAR